VSGALTITLADPGPLQLMSLMLQQRVQAIFPPSYFGFAWMPAKADRNWFKRYVPRCPAAALGWNGVADKDSAGVFAGIAHFTLALIVKNASSVQGRYLGDALGPGLMPMVRAATIALQGWVIDPPDNPFCAQGGVTVSAVANLYNEDWGDEDTAIAALELAVPYEETLPPGMEQVPAGPLALGITWNFDPQAPQIDSTGLVT
jgi:hypothetical protein